MNILLVGNGRWGKNYVTTIKEFSNIKLLIATKENWKTFENISGVIIATNPDSHITIASHFLSKNIPILIEKPVSLKLKGLYSIEQYNDLILVNYGQLFTDAFKKLKTIDNISFITTNGFGISSHNYSDLFDYGVHDLSLILNLINEYPKSINCTKLKYGGYEIKLSFNTCNTISVVGEIQKDIDGLIKARDIEIESDGLVYYYDDLRRPKCHKTPLFNVIQEFLNLINKVNSVKKDDRFGLRLSFDITKILDECYNQVKR